MEKLLTTIGFTKDMTDRLLKKEALQCSGKIYSEEYTRRFENQNDIFRVEKNPTDGNRLELTINRQPIGKWFKEQWGKLRQSMRPSVQEEKKSKEFRM